MEITRGGAVDLYLDLMRSCLTRHAFLDEEVRDLWASRGMRSKLYPIVQQALALRGLKLVKAVDPELRESGRDWPAHAETMVGLRRLANVQACVVRALEDDVPGDLIEAGVWRGGVVIFMRAILAAYQVTDRKVFVADSFQGVPRPRPGSHPADRTADFTRYYPDGLAASIDLVKSNFARYRLLDEQVVFVPGWFNESLAAAPIDKLAVIRLDGDLYESTWDSLTALYPKLSPGGYLIVDDYGAMAACRQAVSEYRAAQGIDDPIKEVDWTAVYWRKSSS